MLVGYRRPWNRRLELSGATRVRETPGSKPAASEGTAAMADTSVTKVEATHAPKGPEGQRYLASGRAVSMRLWDGVAAGDPMPPVRRDYETVGYVISGRAELVLEGQTVSLQAGSSWVVPKGAEHTYRILDAFTAVEVTHPPAEAKGRDAAPAG